MKAKTLAIIGASIFTLGFFAKRKVDDYSEVITKMGMDISNIRNLRTKNLKLFLDCDVTFINTTKIDFMPITGGLIEVKRISIFYKGKLLGNAYSNTTEFSLPAKGKQKISGIEVELLSLNIIDQLLNGSLDSNMANYTIEVEIRALGKTFIVEQ